MLPPTITISFLTVNTFPLLLGIGIFLALGIALLQHRLASATPLGLVTDVCIGAVMGGILIGRGVHVLLHWHYFAQHPQEIIYINAGGLNWHGAVFGVIWVIIVSKSLFKRPIDAHRLLESLAWSIPLLGFLGWWACGTFTCGYGAEIQNLTDYPAWLVWEAKAMNGMNAPRFATQPLGMAWGFAVFMMMVIVFWRSWLIKRRFGICLMLWAMGMLLLGYLRGDVMPHLAGIRLDQWLDGLMIIIGAGYYFWHKPSRA